MLSSHGKDERVTHERTNEKKRTNERTNEKKRTNERTNEKKRESVNNADFLLRLTGGVSFD
jgi:hypothetical protein